MIDKLKPILPWPVNNICHCNKENFSRLLCSGEYVSSAFFCLDISTAMQVLTAVTTAKVPLHALVVLVPSALRTNFPSLTAPFVPHCLSVSLNDLLSAPNSFSESFDVFYTPPMVPQRSIASAQLPRESQNLSACDVSSLAFMFDSRLAGVSARTMFDTGATHNFIDEAFVKQHQLHLEPALLKVHLANGTVMDSAGVVKVKLKIQSYYTTITCRVMPLVEGVDLVLGSAWAQRNKVIADFTQPCLHLRPTAKTWHKPITLFPCVDEPHSTAEPAVISAICAARLLQRPRNGCRPAFLILVRATRDTSSEPNGEADPQLNALVHEYSELFESPSGTQQHLHITAEAIPLEENTNPPNRPAFRLSLRERHEVEARIKEMLEKGWIQPSHSGYGAPVLFVPKPDGSLRMCIDYRALNKITKSNKYPLPRIDDLMDNLSGAQYFSALDLTSGYHQLTLQPSDVPKTAFNTHIGKYEWKVLPMGLKNAPSVFQAVMNQLFSPLLHKCVCVYLDDLLIFSRTKEEHYKHVRAVFELLRKNALRIKASKCEFFKSQLKFLGHLVSAQGLQPDPKKVQVVTDWPRPATVQDVRSFLGLANYFRKYIQGFAKLAAPLTNLLKHLDPSESLKARKLRRMPPHKLAELESKFTVKWSDACQQAFDGLKTALSSEPVLRLPDFDKPFEVVADACSSTPAIGAVLLQEGHPVAFYSRKCNAREGNYSTSDLEMLAVISALKEWRPYLQGGPRFTIVTDHLPNTYVDSASVSSHTLLRRARWLEIASSYDYEWEYRPGRLNVADPISRAPAHFHSATAAAVVLQASTDVPHLVGQLVSRPCVALSGSASPDVRTLGARLRLALPTGTALMCCLCATATRSRARGVSAPAPTTTPSTDDGQCPPSGGDDAPVQGELPEAAATQSDEELLDPPGSATEKQVVVKFSLENFYSRIKKGCKEMTPPASTEFRSEDCLYYQGNCIYIPDFDHLRHECFEAAHSHLWSGHFGVRKTLKRLQAAYWWPNMQRNVEDWIRQCDSCQRNKFQRIAPPGKLHPLQIPQKPWTSISMDWITCLPRTSSGYDAILVVVDRLSKLTHIEPTFISLQSPLE